MNYHQVYKYLRLNYSTVSKSVHNNVTNPYAKVLVPLKNRKILKVSGKDAPNFLQGLITNDMRHFEDGTQSMYAMFLNNKGRVLFDTLIYKWENNDTFLLECDQGAFGALMKHLNIFKLKQKVTIDGTPKDKFCLWALISPADNEIPIDVDAKSPINMFKDPRLSELGCRILSDVYLTAPEVLKTIAQDKDVRIDDDEVYKYLRYRHGIGEGIEDLPPGICFPLEANCDYLHGVSFHKGCYIGQELTARIHHTGVVRKRLMPIKFQKPITQKIGTDAVIKSSMDPKSNLGKLKGYIHDHGLALLRIKEALETKTIEIENNLAEVMKPYWWPTAAPKEVFAHKDKAVELKDKAVTAKDEAVSPIDKAVIEKAKTEIPV